LGSLKNVYTRPYKILANMLADYSRVIRIRNVGAKLQGWGQAAVGAKLQATNRVPRPVDRGTATRYGG